MSQVTWDGCNTARVLNPQPSMIPNWFGFLTDPAIPTCLGPDPRRRKDIPQGYGKKAPVMEVQPHELVAGLVSRHIQPTETIPTEIGPVILPFGEPVDSQSFIPTAEQLSIAPLMGSRMLSLSDRYFEP